MKSSISGFPLTEEQTGEGIGSVTIETLPGKK